MYENIYGLSCIENQVLSILRNKNMDIFPLYYNSAMSLREIFYYVVMMGEKQEYFNKVPRIQEALKELGIITLDLKIQPSMQSVRQVIRSCKENNYVLMKVTPEFTKDILHARGFRDDHYVLVKSNGNNFLIQNDIPERTIILTAYQLTKVYAGNYFKLTVKREMTKNDTEFLLENRKYKPNNFMPSYFYEKDLINISNLGVKLRDMTGIYKTLRHRLAVYYSIYTDTEFIYDALPVIEHHYAVFEYYNLKKNITFEKYFSLLCELSKTENNIMLELRNRLEQTAMIMED